MKKFSLIYVLSFLSYFFVYSAVPYITARIWADIAFYIFIIAVLYQLTYIFYLRKKENVSFSRAVARLFLYISSLINILYAVSCVYIYFFGYTSYTWIKSYKIGNYYGWEAIEKSGMNYVFLLILIPILYQLLYILISKHLKNKAKRLDQ